MEVKKAGRLAHTVEEACERLSMGRTLFYELVRAGEIRIFKIGVKTLVAESELVSFIDRKMKEAA